ncbi:restriction endonuclease subunit S [Candidatus Kryptobacter tengchongensis]|uniref:Type I restriction enzyme, S subunit n=1 Tax=Kryptobacter tengchongensis TaxID=1643429 RepID=A0A916LI27_KRYT1|nr:restriction endonuclease subunit S [Candidatus Kryptobacter tengchongensis]CUS96818.1 type I restriction enzyme, S subunit [Candidatus Kryptobacter tengchongensis]
MKSPWPTKKLGELIEERKEKNKNNEQLQVYAISNIFGFVPSEEFFYKKVYSASLKNYKKVYKDDFAYNPARVNVGSIGLYENKKKGLVSPMYIVFRIKDKNQLLPRFLFRILKSSYFIKKIRSLAASQGSIRQILKFEDLCELQIPLPPLPIQKKIVSILDTIQSAIDIQNKIIEKTKELKKSIMADLFKYGGPSFRKGRKLKKTEIGEIPENWEVVKLGEVVEEISYGISKKGGEKGNYPILRMNNIEDGKIILKDLQFVKLSHEEFNKFRLKKGDVVFNRTNSLELVGKTALFELEGNFVFASYLLKIVPVSSKLLSRYLSYYFNWEPIQKKLKTLASRGASQVNISAGRLRNFKIILPPLSEQREIADILQTIDQKIEIEQKKKELYEELFKTMLNKIFNQEIDIEKIKV